MRNPPLYILGESLWGFQAAMVASATVLVMILREYGAGREMIGAIGSIETVAFLLPQVLGLYLFRSHARRKRELVYFHYLAMLPFLLAMGVLLLPTLNLSPAVRRWSVLGSYALFTTAIGVVLGVWMDWVAGLFKLQSRGTIMGLAFCASSAAGAGGAFLAGWWISTSPRPGIYATLYFVATAIAIASITVFLLIDDPCAADDDSPAPTVAGILGHFGQSLSDRNFRAFLIGRVAAGAGFCILPLVADYYASPEGGALQPGTLVSCGAALTVGAAVAHLGLGRLGDAFGHRLGVLIGVSAQLAALLVLLFVPNQTGCIVAYFAAGICTGSAFLSHYNMIFETCPHENRSAHITLANLVVGGCTAPLPILAGWAAARWGTRTVFALSLVLSVGAWLWFQFQVREPRQGSGRASPGEALAE